MGSQIRRSDTLEPPSPSVELEDSGAHDLDTSGDEQHFSDASEGAQYSQSKHRSPSAQANSPIPKTRVERVDSEARHGEIPGLPEYEKRKGDAVPDEFEVLPESSSRGADVSSQRSPTTSQSENSVPLMVVEKVDPGAPSHGEVPGTAAYEQRRADAAPDLVFKSEDPNKPRSRSTSSSARVANLTSIPQTVVTQGDSVSDSQNQAETRSGGFAEGSPAFGRSSAHLELSQQSLFEHAFPAHFERKPKDGLEELNDGSKRTKEETSTESKDDGVGDSRNDDGDDGDDDDFGDFDDGFQNSTAQEQNDPDAGQISEQAEPQTVFPVPDFSSLSSLEDIIAATKPHLDAICPNTTTEYLAEVSSPESVSTKAEIFPTEHSRALWQYLTTPPPLQPPNWTKSHIRRRFLVSLGVPVDLDEILPPRKQKKLVLSNIRLESDSTKPQADGHHGFVASLQSNTANASTESIDNVSCASRSRRRQRGAQAPPELDLGAVKRLCATTDEKLDGLTDSELEEHIQKLQSATRKTEEVLVYWLKRRDGAIREKEAFEGVIENLVRHARRVRT